MPNKSQQPKSSGKVETMQRILDAARVEFADKGLDKTHIQAVAEAAGVTKQLIYHYYLSKDNLFACVLDESSYHAMTAMAEIDVEHLPPREALRSMIYQMFELFKEDPTLASLATEGIRYHDHHDTPRNRMIDIGPVLTAKMTDIIERGIDDALFHDQMQANYIFATAALMISGTFTSRYLISAVGGFDPTASDVPVSWKTHIADLIINALEKR
jgi:AcrR family transcriptional regulator|tara:strand:- start:7971 stop:8612 length:642 start_codon:yes stop_codon:yes gene_type:complete